jgi:predicted transcriptional regulator of viral defense system
MGTSSKQLLERLRAVAGGQQGFFTSKQAVDTGYADSVHSYHVANGDWEKVHRGIYRLADIPAAEWPELAIWTLWSRGRDGVPQGVFCGETALAIHGHIPREDTVMHMIVPRNFRRNSETPEQLRLYKEDLGISEVEDRGVFRVTTMTRTIRDVMQFCTKPKILEKVKHLAGGSSSAALTPCGPEVTRWPDWDYVWGGAVRVSGWSSGKSFEDVIKAGED